MAFINNYDAVHIRGEGRLAFKITNDITVVCGTGFAGSCTVIIFINYNSYSYEFPDVGITAWPRPLAMPAAGNSGNTV